MFMMSRWYIHMLRKHHMLEDVEYTRPFELLSLESTIVIDHQLRYQASTVPLPYNLEPFRGCANIFLLRRQRVCRVIVKASAPSSLRTSSLSLIAVVGNEPGPIDVASTLLSFLIITYISFSISALSYALKSTHLPYYHSTFFREIYCRNLGCICHSPDTKE